jgi:hypothetical protein
MKKQDFKFTKATYNVSETMDHLSCGRTKLYELIKEKRLTPLKLGNRTLFTGRNIAAVIAALRREAEKKGARRGA